MSEDHVKIDKDLSNSRHSLKLIKHESQLKGPRNPLPSHYKGSSL